MNSFEAGKEVGRFISIIIPVIFGYLAGKNAYNKYLANKKNREKESLE
jgi:hypothetical protein